MLSGRFRHERFTAGPRWGGKGDKSVIPRARSRRWAVSIVIFICYGEEANGIFLHNVYRCAKQRCEWLSRFIAFHGLTLLSWSECTLSNGDTCALILRRVAGIATIVLLVNKLHPSSRSADAI